MENKIKVGIIILNYNNYEDTLECYNSISVLKSYETEIIVVDNCSTNDSFDILKKALPKEVHLIRSDKNRGYAAGNNIGIKFSVKIGCSHICILNNDTIVDSDFVKECVDYLDQNSTVAFVGPTIIDYREGFVQSTGGDINILKGKVNMKNYGKNLVDLPKIISCDYVGGACIVCKVSLLQDIGLIPENYFLFFEETEWCYKALSKGYMNFCLSNVTIIHKGSSSVNAIGDLQEYLMERNRIVFVRRNTSKVRYVFFLIYYFIRNIYRMFKYDISYSKNFKSYIDGMFNKVSKKYPFVICEEEKDK